MIKDPSQEHKETYYRKYRVKKEKEKEKELYDEEDKIMQKILIEDFPKKCKEENRFVRITKHEYYFGEEKIKVIYKDGEVVLQLDEGDYKLQEFIDILSNFLGRNIFIIGALISKGFAPSSTKQLKNLKKYVIYDS